MSEAQGDPTADASGPDPTSMYVRQAVAGSGESQAWIIHRFTPVLLVSARWHLSRHRRGICDAEDLVQEMWAIALPRLADLEPREERYTPVLLKFLSSILLNLYRGLIRRRLRWHRQNPGTDDSKFKTDFMAQLPAATSGVLTKTMRQEAQARLQESVDGLDESDRRVVIMRGIEQVPNKDVAMLLGEAEDTVSVRYRRALTRLRKLLPGSIFDDLP